MPPKIRGLGRLGRKSSNEEDKTKKSLLDLDAWKLNLESRNWRALRSQLDDALGAPDDLAVTGNKSSGRIRWIRKKQQETPTAPAPNPLFATSSSGRTALHWALLDRATPPDIILRIIREASDSAAIYDNKYQLPLHVAVQRGHTIKVVAELLVANPLAVNQIDSSGQSPLHYSVAVAKKQSIKTKIQSWAPPNSDEEDLLEWQDNQDRKWSVVRYLLLASVSHPKTKLEVDDGQPLLLDAMVHSAPPSIVSILIAISTGLLQSPSQGVTVACSAMFLCISRKYPLPILESLANECLDEVRLVRDETGMGLVAAQYVVGCYRKTSKGDWEPRSKHMKQVERCVREGTMEGCDAAFLDWWEKLKFLVHFCHHDGDETTNLLYAALSNRDTPPKLVELILRLEKDTIDDEEQWKTALPLHIAAATPLYVPRKYEARHTEKTRNTLETLTVLHPNGPKSREGQKNRSPLHLALDARKTWTNIKPLVSGNRRCVRARDPVTKLYPFQMAAMMRVAHERTYERLLLTTRNQYENKEWQKWSMKKKERAIAKTVKKDELESIRTIYELLRRHPNAIRSAVKKVKGVQLSRDRTGMGMVGAHFIIWCYDQVHDDFVPKTNQIRVLQGAIDEAALGGSLGPVSEDFNVWWTKMKFWIWYCFQGENGTTPKEGKLVMPREDEYLLHAAISNSDTPPQIIHLLLGLHPASASLCLPQTDVLPLHIAATTIEYTKKFYEEENQWTILELLVRANPDAAKIAADGRLPLHLAIDHGKTWKEMEPLVRGDKSVLSCIDPVTNLFPFQLAAIRRSIKPEKQRQFQHIARNTMDEASWKHTSKTERNASIKKVHTTYLAEVFSSIYELLRKDPSVLISAVDVASESNRFSSENEFISDEMARMQSSVLEMDEEGEADDAVPALNLSRFLARMSVVENGEQTTDTSVFTEVDVMSVFSASTIRDDNPSVVSDPPNLQQQNVRSPWPGADLLSPRSGPEDTTLQFEPETTTEDTRSMPEAADTSNIAEKNQTAEDELVREKSMTAEAFVEATESSDLDLADSSALDPSISSILQHSAEMSPGKLLGDDEEEEEDDDNVWTYIDRMFSPKDDALPSGEQDADTGNLDSKPAAQELLDGKDSGSKTEQDERNFSLTESQSFGMDEHVPWTTPSGFEDDTPEKAGHAGSSTGVGEFAKGNAIAAAKSQLRKSPPRVPPICTDLASSPVADEATFVQKRDMFERAGQSQSTEQSPASQGQSSFDSLYSPQVAPTTPVEAETQFRSGWSVAPAMIQKRRRHRLVHYTNSMQEKYLPCLQCGKNKRETLMLPCSHLCLCSSCSVKVDVKNCLICGRRVKDRRVVYL